jgi:hypothetical protein
MVMLRCLFRAPVLLLPFLFHHPSYCSPSTCPTGWKLRQMPSQVWLIPICFFNFFFFFFFFFYFFLFFCAS